MYKVMIIDDDIMIRERLKNIIDWEGLSLELVSEAGDSETAMELYLLHRPKIIISDISIPVISGLELAEIMRKEDPDLQFIIITGYSDFEWAKQSVRLGAIDLLSKPVFPEVINHSLQKAVDYFRSKQQKQSSVDFLQNLVNDNLPQMQETFMMNLLTKGATDVTDVENQMAQLQIHCPGPYYAVVLLALQSCPEDMNQDVGLFLMRDTVTAAMLEASFEPLTYLDAHSRLTCVLSTADAEPDNAIEEVVTRVQEQLHFAARISLVSGIGLTVDSVASLSESRGGALTAMNYQCILGDSSVMHFKNMERMDTVFHTPEEIHNYLLKLFRENDLEGLSTAIENHVAVQASYGTKYSKRIRNFLFEYVQNITGEALRLGLSVERFDNYLPTMMQLMQSDGVGPVEEVLRLTEQILGCINGRKNGESHHLMKMAKKYIAENLADENLCLETVSDHIGLSRIYFCKLFHQMEGVSFNTYLKQERIEKAKHLLLTTNMKVFEVSNAVGFSQAKYFGYVFKQTVGQTPVEFQKRGAEMGD